MNLPLTIKTNVIFLCLCFATNSSVFANLDKVSYSYFHNDLFQNSTSYFNKNINAEKSSSDKTSLSKLLSPVMEASGHQSNHFMPIDKDLDLQHLTKFSATDFLDKIFGRRIFNVTMDVIVPMFHVLLPMHASSGSTLHLAMQALFGLFSVAVWAVTIIIPGLYTEFSHIVPFGLRRSIDGSNSIFGSSSQYRSNYDYEKFKKLSDKIGLDWHTCLRRTVCETHRFPKHYRIIAIPFQTFVLPRLIKSGEGKLTIRDAATIGQQQNGVDCDEKFKCFFDILDIMQYLIDVSIQ